MNILGIGPFELILVLIIALLILGPGEMVNFGTKLGKFIRRVITSDAWKTMRNTTRELRNMPNRLAREAGLEEFRKQIKEQETLGNFDSPFDDIRSIDPSLDAWTSKPSSEPQDNEGEESGNEQPTPTDNEEIDNV